jgi:hypothetical protein
MEKKLKSSYYALIFLSIFTIFYPVLAVQTYPITISFDSLFPATWYQKGLEASLSVWHILVQAFEKNDASGMAFDQLLGKLVFVQFCVNRMQQEGVVCLPEDVAYLGSVLNKIKELVDVFGGMQENEDFILCVYEIILSIEKQILRC